MEAREVLGILRRTFPECFSPKRRRPLKVGIFDDVVETLDSAAKPAEISAALSRYTTSQSYLRCLRKGAARVDLDGNPVGVVTEREAKLAEFHWLQARWGATQ
jgi:ProP effector